MNQNKKIITDQEPDLNQKEQKRDKDILQTKETDLTERAVEDGDLKPTNIISKNVHIKPAEEQQFEDNSQNPIVMGNNLKLLLFVIINLIK